MQISLGNLTSIAVIKKILEEKGIRPLKQFGQNFLVSDTVLKKIVEVANLKKSDVILEVGPGIGTLTQELAKKAKKVIAIEKDRKLVEVLRENLKDFKNIEIIENDILKLNPKSYPLNSKSYKVVADIPYYITSLLIRRFLELKNPPKEMLLMVQKEVAKRICEKPPEMSLLAVSVQFYAKPKIISYVSRSCFWPRPKVDSAILQLILLNKRRVDIGLFFKIVRAGFSHPRKQLANNLTKELALRQPNGLKLKKEKINLWLLKNNIVPSQRAESLSLEDWLNLTTDFLKNYDKIKQ
jgi:16S rRNA (adenine1518-N6/adenine1519-N6)-dimethyltransferase